MTAPEKSPGQLAYEADLLICPAYADGLPRRTWEQIGDAAREAWEEHPTPRTHTAKRERP